MIQNELKEEISKLSLTIEKSNNESQKLEISNYRLQITMLILTLVTTLYTTYPIIKAVFTFFILNYDNTIIVNSYKIELVITTTSILLSIITSLSIIIPMIKKREEELKSIILEMEKIEKALKDK